MSDAIVILGHALNDDGSAGETLQARLKLGFSLFTEKRAPLVFLTGGVANKTAGIAEATVMKSYLAEMGVPADAIVTETDSLTTVQNAKYSVPIFKKLGIQSITLVSSAYHIHRWYLNPVRLFRLFGGRKLKIETEESR